MQNVNSTLVADDECDLSLLHVVSGYESEHRDRVLGCLLAARLEPGRPRLEVNHPSGPGNDRWTAAHIAACWGHESTLRLLLEHGADPAAVDLRGHTVWEIARAYDQFPCVAVLQQALYAGRRSTLYPAAPVKSRPLPEVSQAQSEYFSCSSASEATLQPAASPPAARGECSARTDGKPKSEAKATQVSFENFRTPARQESTDAHSRRTSDCLMGGDRRKSVDRVRTNLLKRIEQLSLGRDALEDDARHSDRSPSEDGLPTEQPNESSLTGNIRPVLAEVLGEPDEEIQPSKTLTDSLKEELLTDDESRLVQESSDDETTLIEPRIMAAPEIQPRNSNGGAATPAKPVTSVEPPALDSPIRLSLISQDRDRSVELYEDRQFGVSLLNESRKSTLCRPTAGSTVDPQQLASPNHSIRAACDEFASLQDCELRARLVENGLSPGPITESTKKLYAKKLRLLMDRNAKLSTMQPVGSPRSPARTPTQPQYSNALNQLFAGRFDFAQAKRLEREFQDYFERSSQSKVYFTYLLLDPRVTQNLVDQARDQEDLRLNWRLFEQFVRAIFYIGKGQGNRPFMHLYEAALLNGRTPFKRSGERSAKLGRILDIWADGQGVISLHCFHSICSPEALSRECFMMNAIGLRNLTNIQIGQNRVRDLLWTEHKRLQLGAYLLYKAFNLLLVNGERQIRKADVQR